MKVTMRPYDGSKDFLTVRNFLKTAYYAFGKPTNWGLDRWNWGRYHPMMLEGDQAASISHFEGAISLWEEAGRLVAMVNTEQPRPNGEVWVQRLPVADRLLDSILERAEATMANPADGLVKLDIYDHDAALLAAARRRGYTQDAGDNFWSERALDAEQAPQLPAGFRLRHLAEPGCRPELVCRALGRGFNHADPAEWMTPDVFRQVQAAPDFRLEQAWVVEAPDGEYASFCIVWYDDLNHFGVFEPVCTQPEYRRRGLGRAVIQAGLNCLHRLGARTAYVGSGQAFYAAIGFRRAWVSHTWQKAVHGGGRS